MSELAAIALGANLGDPAATFERALALMAERAGVVRARSRWLASEALIHPDDSALWHPPYLNGVVLVETDLAPLALLSVLQGIEAELGRDRDREEMRWQPRPLDLDIIALGERTLALPGLSVPHPRMHERDFVLRPLVELWPDWRHPVLQATARDLLAALDRPEPGG